MNDDVRCTVERANAQLAILLNDARSALRGESKFGVDEIHNIRRPMNEMTSVLSQSANLRKLMPEMSEQLDLYKLHLGQLQAVPDQIRVMLLIRQATILAGRAHMDAVTHWMAAFQATR
jgi:hypothetical protein